MKKNFLIAILCVLIISTSVLAANIIAENIVNEEINAITSVQAVQSKINENFTEISVIKKPEQFSSIVDCHDRAEYENVYAYTEFLCENAFNSEQISVINKILDKGTTVQSLNQVYDFWLSTDEEFSIIEEICALEDTFFSEFWYEDAFNRITNNEHGVLTSEDISSYKESGISADEILAANVLCRKKGQNIFDILDRIKGGQTIEELAIEIYGISVMPEADSEHEKMKKLVKAKKYNVPQNLLENKRVNLSETVEQLEKTYSDLIREKAEEEFKRLDISKPQYSQEEDYEIIKDCDFPISVINALVNKGYTPQEMERISQIETDDIIEAAKIARREMINEK